MEEGLKIEVKNDRYNNEITEESDEGELDIRDDDDEPISRIGNKGSGLLSHSTGIKVTVFNDQAENMDKEDGEVSEEEAMDVDSNSDELEEYQKALGIRISFNPNEKQDEEEDDQIEEDGQIKDLTPSPPPYSPRPRQYHQRYNNKRKGFRSNPESIPTRIYPNPYLEIFDPEKLNSRALRFGADSEKKVSQPSDNNGFQQQLMKKPTDEDILDIYSKNGLLMDDGEVNSLDKVGSQFRTEALLVRGTNDMSTDDIFMYFAKNRQNPLSLEWVNDACCVVVFKSSYDAASCVINMTKPIVHFEKKKKEIVENNEEEVVDFVDDDSKKEEDMIEDFDFYNVDKVSSKMVTVPMPPGSVWRFCPPCEKAKGIIIRFATTSDKKQERAEKYSEFYKKHGNPNQIRGNERSNNKRHYTKVDNDEKQEARVEPKKLPSKPVSNKLAWTELSALWNEEEQGIKRKPGLEEEREKTDHRRKEKVDSQPQRREKSSFNNDDRAYGLGGGLTISVNLEGNELREYFNRKRKHEDSFEQLLSSNPPSDDDDEESNNQSQDSIWSKKLRRPRMKMHADEEEEKIRKRNSRPSAAEAGGILLGQDMARGSRGPYSNSYDNRDDIDFSMGHQQDFHRGTRYSHSTRNTGNREGRTRVRRQLARNRIESSTTKNFNNEWDLRQIIQNRKKNNLSTNAAVPRFDLDDDDDDEELNDIFDLVDGR